MTCPARIKSIVLDCGRFVAQCWLVGIVLHICVLIGYGAAVKASYISIFASVLTASSVCLMIEVLIRSGRRFVDRGIEKDDMIQARARAQFHDVAMIASYAFIQGLVLTAWWHIVSLVEKLFMYWIEPITFAARMVQ